MTIDILTGLRASPSQPPLVSVLIPAYNHERFVQDAIRSIISQSYPNMELVVIDDGSTDTTWQKVVEMRHACEARFARVELATQENRGICETSNALLERAHGDYVYPFASDDLAYPHAVQRLVDFLEEHKDYALCVGDCTLIDDDGKPCYWDSNQRNVYQKDQAQWLSMGDFVIKTHPHVDFLSSDFGSYLHLLTYCNFVPNGYLIRRSIFEKTGPFIPEAPLEDYWLMLQISKHAKMKYLPEPLAYYRSHATNTMRNSELMQEMTFAVYMRELEQLGDSMPRWAIAYKADKLRAEIESIKASRSWRYGQTASNAVRRLFPSGAFHTKGLRKLLRAFGR